MSFTIPNILTLIRIALIPVLVIVYYLPFKWAPAAAAAVFVAAGVTDWLDGYLARKLQQLSHFGAFLDPVADKLIVAVALVLLLADPQLRLELFSPILFAVMAAVIIGREITVSALREWMAEVGARASVAVSMIGKLKTLLQIVAISLLLYQAPVMDLPTITLGEMLLYLAGALTLWSMLVYLQAAWPVLTNKNQAR